jgi:two-component system sensor histidine kinase PilS (NtrC family)
MPHEEEIVRLNHLNDLVLNRLQEAVVVIDDQGSVWLYNTQASLYFPTLSLTDTTNLFMPLVQRWQSEPQIGFDVDYSLLDEDLHIRAKPLLNQNPALLILFMRPQQEIAAELQSNKLASLGQLTANIAHEIRNPLSAIRHANELLRESYETRPMQKLGCDDRKQCATHRPNGRRSPDFEPT